MAGAMVSTRLRADLVTLVAKVPLGRVATHKLLARELGVSSPHVASLVAGLSDAERRIIPWWRVVADGGAIGRHALRDDQMARLRDEHLQVSPAGVVQDLAAVMLKDFATADQVARAPSPAPAPAKARSRGIKDKPTSSV